MVINSLELFQRMQKFEIITETITCQSCIKWHGILDTDQTRDIPRVELLFRLYVHWLLVSRSNWVLDTVTLFEMLFTDE